MMAAHPQNHGPYSNDEWTFLTNKQMTESFANGGVDAAKEIIQNKMSEWMDVPLNLAFVGQTGVGKSKLINTFLDLTAEDEGAARVGIVQQTMVPTAYAHPKLPNLKLWDLPGGGTKEYPWENYLDLVAFKKYDYFLIVSATRFMKTDQWLAQEIQKRKKRFIFVRTKIGIDFANLRNDYPTSYQQRQQQMQNELLVDIEQNLGEMFQRGNVFLVDSNDKFTFEFNALQEHLIETFPDEKRNALLRSLTATSKSMVQAKVDNLRNDIKWLALASAATGAIPVPGVSVVVDITISVTCSAMYFRQLGLNEASLERQAQSCGIPVQDLKEVVGDAYKILNAQGMLSFLKTIPFAVAMNTGEEAVKAWMIAIPAVSAVVGAVASYIQTDFLLNAILDKLEPIAARVLEIAVSESAKQNMDN